MKSLIILLFVLINISSNAIAGNQSNKFVGLIGPFESSNQKFRFNRVITSYLKEDECSIKVSVEGIGETIIKLIDRPREFSFEFSTDKKLNSRVWISNPNSLSSWLFGGGGCNYEESFQLNDLIDEEWRDALLRSRAEKECVNKAADILNVQINGYAAEEMYVRPGDDVGSNIISACRSLYYHRMDMSKRESFRCNPEGAIIPSKCQLGFISTKNRDQQISYIDALKGYLNGEPITTAEFEISSEKDSRLRAEMNIRKEQAFLNSDEGKIMALKQREREVWLVGMKQMCRAKINSRYNTARIDRYGNRTGFEISHLDYFNLLPPRAHRYGNNKALVFGIFLSNQDRYASNSSYSMKIYCILDEADNIIGLEMEQ